MGALRCGQEASGCCSEPSTQPTVTGGEGGVDGVRESLRPVHSSNTVTEKGGGVSLSIQSCMNGPELKLQLWRGEQRRGGGSVCSLQRNKSDSRSCCTDVILPLNPKQFFLFMCHNSSTFVKSQKGQHAPALLPVTRQRPQRGL